MQFSESWLRSLVNPPLDSAALAHQLTMAGLEVEALEPAAPPFTHVVIGEILTASKHPDADRLQVCTVSVGGAEPLQIVCGAPNARAGLKTACAVVGAELPNDFKIKRAKVRGVESFGMLCSARELGLESDADGILELPAEAPVGRPLREYFDLDDQIFTLKLTPNRGDCLSMSGVAREVAAITRVDWTPVASVAAPVTLPASAVPAITVSAAVACPRYCGRWVRGLRLDAQTPAWMQTRLQRAGVRCLHPVVDITNYVLLELGQPMHAFAADRLQGAIEVRWARVGETLRLLNGAEVKLDAETLVIADATGPVAMAGVMGGQASAVSDTTLDVLLEAAHFTPAAVAGRARHYGLVTDSAHRFERGVDPQLPERAMERATELLLEICGGAAGPIGNVGAAADAPRHIAFRPERARRVLGLAIADVAIGTHFERLGFGVARAAEGWQVAVPSYRFDLSIEVDLIEEIARLHGYDQLPTAFPAAATRMQKAGEDARTLDALKARLVARGWQEVVTYSFIAPEEAAWFAPAGTAIRLVNPLSAALSVMRASLLPGLVQTLRHNLNHGQERVRIFEAGRCFSGVEAEQQPRRLAGLLFGSAQSEQWGSPLRAADFYDLKAELDALAAPLCLDYQVPAPAAAHAALHPGQSAQVLRDGQVIGWIGSLHPHLVQTIGLPRAALVFEVDLPALQKQPLPGYAGVARLPAVRRDLAVLLDEAIPIGTVVATVRAQLPAAITAFDVFDVYRGKGLPLGKKSVAFKMLLQHTEKTLTDTEIESLVSSVLQSLTQHFGAVLRGGES